MCGIAGYIGKKPLDNGRIQETLNTMKNRGPDHQDYASWESAGNQISFLHSRLSIIDLDARSNQPFRLEHVTLAFNGEIYNYLEIRKTLEERGHRFITSSDTEVLLRSYLEYGKDCVLHFEGMWSFALYDANSQELFLSRDRFAEKPLYYYENEEGFYFASETSFLAKLVGHRFAVNQQHLYRYLVNGYKSLYKEKDTYFQDVHEVKYASNVVVNPELQKHEYRYWTPEVKPVQMTFEEAVEGSRERLIESMRIRLRSDVPLAFCLSGGVDSAGLVSIAAKEFNYDVSTFSIIDSDERYNEYDNIKATIDDLGCKHTLVELSTDNMLDRLRDLIAYHDAPIATITYLVHSMLSELISENGYKVAFSGTSADELFTGYYDHFNLHLYEMRNHPDFSKYLSDWEAHTGKFVRNPYFKNPNLYIEDPNIREHIYLNNDVFAKFLKHPFTEGFHEEKFTDSLLRNRMLNELFHEATPLVLHEDDLNSMRYSIENRSPYLDSRLFDFANSIPPEHLIKEGYGKHVLRSALDGLLNDKVRLDRQKKGFNAALSSIINLKGGKDREFLLEDSPVFDLIDRDAVRKVMDMDELPNSFSKFMFNFINVKLFLELN